MRCHTTTILRIRDVIGEYEILSDESYEYTGPVEQAKQTGEQKQENQLSNQKSGMQLGLAPGYQQQASQVSGTLLPAYQSILKNPGYSAADKTSITNDTLGGLGAAAGAAQQEAGNRVARTRNDAGYASSLDDLARTRMQESAKATAGLGTRFADVAMQDRDKALAGMESLYGVDTNTMNALLGGQPHDNSQQNSFGQQLLLQAMHNASNPGPTP